MTDTTSWRDAYARRAQQIIGAKDISIGELAQRLDLPEHDAADIADILRRWAQRAARKPTTCPSTRVWLEHSN